MASDGTYAPLVTIVTPSYNQGPFIRATIESVLSQDYPHIEYIIMDGGSTDETASIAVEYASRLRFISERDRGQSHAINKGFRMASGEIVAWLNSDDLLLDGAVSCAVRSLRDRPRAGAVYGEGYLLDRDGRVTSRFPHTQPVNLWRLVHVSDYILQQSVFFRRSVIEELGYLDESLHYTMDWDILIRIAKRYDLVYVPEYMGAIREYPEAKSFSGGRRRIAEIGAMLRRHTGMRIPPGHVVYGLESYRRIWREWIERKTPRLLRGPSSLLISLLWIATGKCIERSLEDRQGWYSDGWASPRVRCMLPPGEGAITVRGYMPSWPTLREQTIRVLLEGERAAEATVTPGDFAFDVPVPERLQGRALRLELRAARHLIPHVVLGESDHRAICYVLREVAWKDRERLHGTAASGATYTISAV
ncbi:MAG: glycosyltransferase family 2 protein [Bryobacteraceae bacterium]